MHRYRSSLIVALVALAFALDFGSIAHAQVGKGSIVDVNTAAEKDLLALPQMTPAIVKGIIEKLIYPRILAIRRAKRHPDSAGSIPRFPDYGYGCGELPAPAGRAWPK